MTEWFVQAYLRLHPHRHDEDAAELPALVQVQVPPRERDVLDFACRAGQHAAKFCALGAWVVRFDASIPLRCRAKHRTANEHGHFVRGDMRRLPFGHACFDLLVKLLTRVGVFSSDARRRTVVDEAVRVLRPGGRFILDVLGTRWAMVRKAGLRVVRHLGDYGSARHTDAAPRIILIAESS